MIVLSTLPCGALLYLRQEMVHEITRTNTKLIFFVVFRVISWILLLPARTT